MKKFAIFSYVKLGKQLKILFDKNTFDFEIKFFLDYDPTKWGLNQINDDWVEVISLWKFINYYDMKKVDGIIIPEMFESYIIEGLVSILKSKNITNIYIAPAHILSKGKLDNEDLRNIIIKYEEFNYLPYLEFHVCDHCNLNCNGCTHFSPLVNGEKFTDFLQFQKDINRLGELFTNINEIRILGGEPLLNPELYKYIEEVKKVFPHSFLHVVTNGLIIKNIDEKLMDTCKKAGVIFDISCYKPMWGEIEDIKLFLRDSGIKFRIEPPIINFHKILNLDGDSNKYMIYSNCIEKRCKMLYNGRISTCAMPFLIKYFNKYFNINILSGENDTIDIYNEELTVIEIIKKLNSPMDMCKNCSVPQDLCWSNKGSEKRIDDWIVNWNQQLEYDQY